MPSALLRRPLGRHLPSRRRARRIRERGLLPGAVARETRQSGWRWCNRCQGLFFGGHSAGVCATGFAHDESGSGDYSLDFAGDSSDDDVSRLDPAEFPALTRVLASEPIPTAIYETSESTRPGSTPTNPSTSADQQGERRMPCSAERIRWIGSHLAVAAAGVGVVVGSPTLIGSLASGVAFTGALANWVGAATALETCLNANQRQQDGETLRKEVDQLKREMEELKAARARPVTPGVTPPICSTGCRRGCRSWRTRSERRRGRQGRP